LRLFLLVIPARAGIRFLMIAEAEETKDEVVTQTQPSTNCMSRKWSPDLFCPLTGFYPLEFDFSVLKSILRIEKNPCL
jgi:hypothetical protein